MRIVREAIELKKLEGPVFVTLGNFDGLHLGHQKIIRELVSRARQVKGMAVVVTFEPHPRGVLNPGEPLFLMTTMDHRLRLFEQIGVDLVWIMRFDKDFANISANDFVEELLFPNLKFCELIVGKNYVFGKNRQGNADFLKSLSQTLGFQTDFIDPVKIEESVVSSSAIRRLIREGRLNEAARLLGRPYSVCGPVIKGSGIGAQIGFRTANLDSDGLLLPPRGVYAVEVKGLSSGSLLARGLKTQVSTAEKDFSGITPEAGTAVKWKDETWIGVANIGVRPTVEEMDRERLEVHILDFQSSIYGSVIEVVFMEKLREEVRFPDKTSLEKQIRKDVENVRMKFLAT